MAGRIGVVGSNNVDLMTYIRRMPAPGETLPALDFAIGFGGKGANQAVAAARLGSHVTFVTRLGDDLFGPQQQANLTGHGIDLTHARVAHATASGVAPIFVDPTGENSILTVPGANAALTPDDVDAAEAALAECDVILTQLEVPLDTVYHTIALAARHGVRCILNPAPARDLDMSRLAGLAMLTPNRTELAQLSGLPTGTDAQIDDAARSLIARGVGQIVVTLGAEGARWVTADAVHAVAAVPVSPVDTTGAGDGFIGALGHFLADGMPTPAALDRAARYAALSVTGRGAQGSYADGAGFAEFLTRHPCP